MFDGQRYWIIGASEGLGRALAMALDARGARLVISARSRDRLEELAKTLSDPLVVPMDVTDRVSVAQAASEVGQIDGVIYCVGLYQPMTAQEWNAEQVEAMCAANFTGAVHVLGHVVPDFVSKNAGHIVLIGSLAGFRGLPGAIGYGASKAGLMHLADTLYADLRHSGVKVQLMNPGFIKTRLTEKNDFAMPQLMSAEKAAGTVMRAMESGRFQTNFPAPFAWLFRLRHLVPRWVFGGGAK
ncbi:SDR family NAD(P)-dependent oxidoreductase [Aliiroseovarius sp. YM-037]|uniref:SDR family NAD(P)-dependent oxidoreductase n=1 Tax=Aliiroseovarius sp. YM-037 TaxID=3341728 RepID=UPI003A80ADF3